MHNWVQVFPRTTPDGVENMTVPPRVVPQKNALLKRLLIVATQLWYVTKFLTG